VTAALELSEIRKRFGALTAVDGVSLSVAQGQVLALVGENGAGKSTLISVACGLYKADAGSVRAFGRELKPGDARAAIDAGIGVVHQHFMLVGPLTVWENVVLGREPRRFGLAIDVSRARREVAEAAARAGLSLDVDARVESLTVAAQQRVEIVKQLWRGARVLILDEPTAVLAPREIEELLRTVRALAGGGRSVIFVSHKLREVMAVADRVAVLRRGRLVRESARAETSAGELAEAVAGGASALAREDSLFRGAPQPLPSPILSSASDTLLRLSDLQCSHPGGRPALRGLTLALSRGEVLGIAGVDGNGQSELAEVLAGLRPFSGEIQLDGAPLGATPAAVRRQGVVHLPEDRHRRGLCLPLSLEENIALGRQREAPFARGFRADRGRVLIDREGRRERAEQLLRAFDVRPPLPLHRAASLSGGNQQKLVAARELGQGAPKLVVAVQPTRGLDLVAAARVHEALREVARRGAGVCLISLDLDELRALATRIAVLYDGRIAGFAAPDAPDDELGRLMLGQERAHG
jgi:simple sugar transport system ATP-binding protein